MAVVVLIAVAVALLCAECEAKKKKFEGDFEFVDEVSVHQLRRNVMDVVGGWWVV